MSFVSRVNVKCFRLSKHGPELAKSTTLDEPLPTMTLRSALVATLAAAAYLAAAFPPLSSPATTNSIKSISKSSFCQYPEIFQIRNFEVWIPDLGNNHSTFLRFSYLNDIIPQINTTCHLNGTSVNTGTESQPRYACENKWIHFNWKDFRLNVMEKACPIEDQ